MSQYLNYVTDIILQCIYCITIVYFVLMIFVHCTNNLWKCQIKSINQSINQKISTIGTGPMIGSGSDRASLSSGMLPPINVINPIDLVWLLIVKLGAVQSTYGPKAVGREKSALRVTKQPSLRETSWANGWSQQLALLDSWESLSRPYAQEISPSWDHF